MLFRSAEVAEDVTEEADDAPETEVAEAATAESETDDDASAEEEQN